MTVFGERMRILRQNLGISQQQVADKLNISRNLLSNYERGIRQPDYQMLVRLANFYEVSLDYLLGRSDTYKTQNVCTNRETEVINRVLRLSDESIRDLLRYVDLLELRDAKEQRQYREWLQRQSENKK